MNISTDGPAAAPVASPLIELEGGSVLRVSKINAVVMPEDYGWRYDLPALQIGTMTIFVSPEKAKLAKELMLLESLTTVFLAPERGVTAQAKSYSGGQVSAADFGQVAQDRSVKKAELDKYRQRLRWLHQQLMQTDAATSSRIGLPDGWTDLEDAIDDAMEAEAQS